MKDKTIFMQKFAVVVLLATICDLLWGSAFPCIKLGYKFFNISSDDTASQIFFAGLRFTLAGLLVIIFMSFVKRRFLVPRSLKTFGRISLLSCFQTILQYILFYIGLAHTNGVKGSIIEASNVFIAIFVASLIFKQEKLTTKKLIGSLIGFIGVVIINLKGLTFDLNIGDMCVFMSTFAYAVSSVLLKRYSTEEDTVMMSGYQFLFGGIIMTLIGLLLGGKLTVFTTQGIVLLVYLAFISAMAYSLWAILLTYNPISKVAVMGFLNPVFGVILSAIILNEGDIINLRSIVALILVCVGICVVYMKERQTST
ncbi:MAG: DMT family transporter [Lachnospiraceae bacterium]|nr:DMT family transporter [Lachnospiraceae bacterium]